MYPSEDDVGDGPSLAARALDLDEDGADELYLLEQIGRSRERDSRALVVYRTENGEYRTHSLHVALPGRRLEVGDFDGDRQPDLISVGPGVSMYPSVPGEIRALGPRCTLDEIFDASTPAVGDFDADGLRDLVFASGSSFRSD